MLKCRKSIFFFAFLFIIISVGVMALSDGLVNREEIRMAELEKQQLQTPSTSSDISETALGQAQDAAVQAKIEMEAAIKAKIAMEEEANRGAEKQANFPSLKAKGGVAIQKSEFGYTTLGARPDFLKEEYNGPANVVDMEMISRQGGDDVASATVVGGLPFSSSGTTSGYNDDYDEACPYTGSTSPDVVYSYTPSANISVDISLCVGSAYDTKLYVYENSVTAGSPYACNDDACPGYVSELLGVALTGGNTYYIVIDGYGGAFGDYTIDINENAPPPPFDCPVSSFDENEACGSDANGGCNMATPTFEAIACGDTVCGTAWADGGTRDTDWYQLTLTSTGTITMSGSAEFPFVLGVIDTADCNLVSSIDPYAVGNPGETVSVSRVAGPGTYWLFVGQQGFYDYPCGSATGYWASIECEAPSAPANDDCANAEVVGDVVNLPYSTDLATFDGVGTCNTAPNIWYSYTASCDGDLTVSLCGSSYDTKLAVYEGTSCDPLGVEVGCNDDLCGLQSEVAFTTTAGSTYLIEVGGYSAATGNGLLSISCGAACAECPVGGIPEGEACIADDAEDNFNGGCNSTPAVFSTINCGETVCGEANTYLYQGNNYRDTDWYLLSLTESQIVTWAVEAEFDVVIFIINAGSGDCTDYSIVSSNSAGPCTPISLTENLPAGDYYLWVGPSVFSGYPCSGGTFSYTGSVTCEPYVANEGDDCSNPIKIDIPTLPYSDLNQTTCGRGNSYSSTCLGSYDGGEDIIYEITVVGSTVDVDITLDPKGTSWTGISISDACPGASCIDQSTSSSGSPHGMTCVTLDPGVYYVMVDTWPSPDCITDFDLTITEGAGCTAPLNDDCASAEEIGDVFELPFNTDNASFDGLGTCQSAANVWYAYTATCDGEVLVSLCGSSYDTKLAVYDGTSCDPLGAELGCNDDACGLQSEVTFIATAGSTYLIEVGGYSTNTGAGVLSVSCSLPCSVECPAEGIPENEACGDDVNGGCNMGAPAFETINCGDVICGTGWADAGTRDTDWYEFTLDNFYDVTWEVTAEFPILIFLMNSGSGDCSDYTIISNTSSDDCVAASLTETLGPGTYWAWAGNSGFYDNPCGNGLNDYVGSLTCVPATPAYCDASGGCDEYIENVTVAEINNTTGCDGYGDYTALVANMSIGMSYPISISIGAAWSSDAGAVWIDWNQDFVFTPDEQVPLSGTPGYGPYTGTVVVPGGALNGPTRMRVRLTYAATPEPCGATPYGEAEDYTVNVGGSPSYLTVDPADIDFGLVGPEETGNTTLTLGVDGDMDLDFAIEIDYGGGGKTYPGYDIFSSVASPKDPYMGPGNVRDPNKVGGDDIASATVISSLPYSDNGNTGGFTDDYDEVCPYSGSTSPDVVYAYTPAVDEVVNISLCASGYDTKLFLYENSYTPGSPFACNDDACPGYRSELVDLPLIGGNTYYIVIDGYGGDYGDYQIDMDVVTPPEPFACPEGSVDENEACGADANGGCNMATPSFEAINCADTVCGTVWADGGTRDTDWYELTMYQTGVVEWTASAEFPFVIGFVDTSDCNMAASLDPYGLGNPGETITVSRTAGPGTYWLFVSHQTYYDYPCGSATGYWATAQCDAGTAPILWLDASPSSGTVPAAGTVPVTVSFDATGLDQGVHTANLLISNSGGKGLTSVPVTLEVGTGIVSVFDPDTVYVIDKFAVDPVGGAIYVGSGAVGGDVNNIANVGLALDACSVPLGATEIITGGWAGIPGDVLKIPFGLADYIACEEARQADGLVWDGIDSFFDVTYELSGTPGTYNSSVHMIGHISGDVNLDGTVDIADLIYMVDFMFSQPPGPSPRIIQTADVNGSGGDPDIGDLVYMVDYMFEDGPPLVHQ